MKVSLCVVARNEAGFLDDCIESARAVVDEIVVVDTGSTDGTPDVAARAGALVVRRPWPGDLGRAHDLPLEHATGDWVLSLDADEVLDPSRRRRVRDLVASPSVDGYRLPIRNYGYEPLPKWRPADPTDPLARGALGFIPTRPVRLFRRRPAHRFLGHLHQAIEPSILRDGGRVADADVPIHHYGALRSDRWKSPLYARLARLEAAARPRDPRPWIELGVVLFGHDRRGALAAFRRARALGSRATAGFFLGWLLLELGRPAHASPLLRAAIRGATGREPVDYDAADAWEQLARAHEMRGRRREAERAYRRAMSARPDSPVAMTNLAGMLLDRGAAGEARKLLDRLLRRYRGLAAVWATLGVSRLGTSPEAARHAFGVALDIDPLDAVASAGLRSIDGRRDAGARAAASSPARPSRRARHRLASARRLVVSLAPRLGGVPGDFLDHAIAALEPWRQLLLCPEPRTEEERQRVAGVRAAGVQVRQMTSLAAMRTLLRRTRPDCVVLHCSAPEDSSGPLRVADEPWIAVGHLPLPMPEGFDAYVVGSAFHDRLQGHLPPARRHVIPCGVDLARGRRRARAPGGPVTIAMLARLEPGAFPRRLLAHLPPSLAGVRVLVAGRGARRFEIEPDVARLGLTGTVRFVGPLTPAEIPAFLAGADIGLHLTELHEEVSCPAVLRMLAAGLPVVAQPRGCLPELVVPGLNGLLGRSEREIAGHLADLAGSPARRRRMGAAARRTARQHDAERFRSSFLRLVSRLARRPGTGT